MDAFDSVCFIYISSFRLSKNSLFGFKTLFISYYNSETLHFLCPNLKRTTKYLMMVVACVCVTFFARPHTHTQLLTSG